MAVQYDAASKSFLFSSASTIVGLIGQSGVSNYLSKTYNTGDTLASRFYNGEKFGTEIGNQIPITYGETLLTGKIIDSGEVRADFDPDKIIKVYHFINGESGAKGIKEGIPGVPDSKLQNIIVNCNAVVDSDTGEAKIHGVSLKEMAVPLIAGGLLLAAPTIAKLFKKDPLTGKEIATSVAEQGLNMTDLIGKVGTPGYILVVGPDGTKAIEKQGSVWLEENVGFEITGGKGGTGGDGGAGGGGGSGGTGGTGGTGDGGSESVVDADPTAQKDCHPQKVVTSISYAPPPEKQRTGAKLLVHQGSTGRYWSEQIDLTGKKILKVHFLYNGLFLKETKTNTWSNSTNPPTTTTCNVEGTVKIRYCIISDGKTLDDSVITYDGLSNSAFTKFFEIDLATALSALRSAAGTGATCSPYTANFKNATLRLYRVDEAQSSTDVYFEGYDYVEGQSLDNVPKKFDPIQPVPSCPQVTKIADDGVAPRVRPAGAFGVDFCPPVSNGIIIDPGTGTPGGGGSSGGSGTGGTPGTPGQPGDDAQINIIAKDGNGNPIAPVDPTAPTLKVDGDQLDTTFSHTITRNPLPSYTAALGANSTANTVTVTFQISEGFGSFTTNTTSAPATFAWDGGSKTATIAGPLVNVNTILHGPLEYVPTADDANLDVSYSGKIVDSDSKQGTLSGTPKLLNNKIARDAASANATVVIMGNTGTIQLLANGIAISNAVSFATNINTTAANLITNINTTKTTPDYAASGTGSSITVSATSALGSDANGWTVTAVTTGDMRLASNSALTGGVTKTKATTSLSDKLTKGALAVLPILGAGLIANTLYKSLSQASIELPESVAGEDPNVSVVYQGQMVPCPNNYDANTNTYTGTWDYATFSDVQYTTNPAWCLLDFMKSKRYGCGNNLRFDDAQWTQIYKDLYVAAQRCDEKPSDGRGGTGLRYTLNTQLASLTRLEVIESICSTMHAQPVFTSNGLRIVQDRPQAPKMVVTAANVIEGEFEQSGGTLDASYNWVEVTYNQPDDYYALRTTAVYNGLDVVTNGDRKNAVTAFGCTNEAQAKRHAAWILQNEKSNPLVVSYTAGFDHADLIPGDIVIIVDTDDEKSANTNSIGGRVLTTNGTNSYTVDRDGGTSGQMAWWVDTDGNLANAVATFSGRSMNIGTNTLPLYGVFVTTASATAADNQWKILSISENDNGQFAVTAVKHDPDKYTVIDNFDTI